MVDTCFAKGLKRAAKAARGLLFLVGSSFGQAAIIMWTPSTLAVRSQVSRACQPGDLKAEPVPGQGWRCQSAGRAWHDSLHHAVNADVRGSRLEMVKLLLQRGANVHAVDDTLYTPLHLASHMETAQVLLDAGADVNARTRRNGETLLFSAAWGAAQGRGKNYETYLNLTKMLIARGADVNLKLRSGSMIEEDAPYRDKPGDAPLHGVARSYSEVEASEVCSI